MMDAQKKQLAIGWYAIGVLVLITLFGFVDRQVFLLLAEPIKVELKLSDTQLGTLQGLGVALFAAIVAYPIGWLADRYNRRFILSCCIAVWSLSVVACAFSDGFIELFFASAMVGAGEAGLVPITYALIPQIFKGQQRLLANSVFSVATRLGVGLAMTFCALLIVWAEQIGPMLPEPFASMSAWRLTFVLAAAPAPLMIVLLLSIRIRFGKQQDISTDAPGESAGYVPHVKANLKTFMTFYGGMAAASFGFASILSWIPTLAIRYYGVETASAAAATGTATLIATVAGFIGGLFLIRKLAPMMGNRLAIFTLAFSTAASGASALLILLANGPTLLYVVQGLQMGFTTCAFMLLPTALQDMGPRSLTARIVAVNQAVIVVAGHTSPVFVGILSDMLSSSSQSLLIAAVCLSASFLFLSSLLFWSGRAAFDETATASQAVNID